MIYFCIPAHNEERTVGVVLWKLRQVMAELKRDYQIIVVDDASSDSTPSVLSPYIRVLPLTVFRNAERRGYADSLEIALREAVRRSPYPKRDAVIALQADFTEDPDIVPALVKRIEAGVDVVSTDARLEPGAPRLVRWGRRLFRWLLRRHEWATVGDPLSGLRAYRIVILKRALDARGAARLLTWNGLGANVELLAQTVPLSRRTDAVETTIKHHRLQRPSRFEFMATWRQVRGAAHGKPAAAARPLPVESSLAAPQPIAIAIDTTEPARPRERTGHARRRQPGARTQSRPPREPRRRKERVSKDVSEVAGAIPDAAPAAEVEKTTKKRRRSRRKKSKRPQSPTLVVENGAPVSPAAADHAAPVERPATTPVPADAAPKKKSRRGRRGGRGRRRGPRPIDNQQENQSGNGGDPSSPLAAEGD